MKLLADKSGLNTAKQGRDKSDKRARILVIKYLYPGISALMLLALMALLAFLHFDVYLSIGHARSVAQLQQQILEEDLKVDALDQAIQAVEAKKINAGLNLPALKNPFERKWEIKK
jgi:hypothetical protein